MPVYIYEPNAFEKMVEVEGEDYRICKTKETLRDCSFDAFLEKWKKEFENNPRARKFKPRMGISVEGNGAIYGLGGWNRYTVRNNGEILFIRGFERRMADIEKAKEVGFRIF